jgi:hypothetical protein
MKSTIAAGTAMGRDDSSPSPAAAAAAAASCERIRRAEAAIGRDDSLLPHHRHRATISLQQGRGHHWTGRLFFYLCPHLCATSHRTGRLSFPLYLEVPSLLRHGCAATGQGQLSDGTTLALADTTPRVRGDGAGAAIKSLSKTLVTMSKQDTSFGVKP